MKGKLIKVHPISKKFHNVFRFTRRTAEIRLENGSRYRFLRHVLETGPAVSVLPYFYNKLKNEWYVILIRQYRPAVDALCLEAPGGLTKKGKNLKSEMARELLEEAGFKVKPASIQIIGKQHLANSFCDQVINTGIVELKIDDSNKWLEKNGKDHGLISEREFTELVILPLKDAVNKPDLITYTLTKFQVLDLALRLKYQIEGKK